MLTPLLVIALAQPAPAPVDLLVKGGTLVTMDREQRTLRGASLAIRGRRIEAVLPSGQALPEARETIDADGHLVIPGLINAHGHLPMVLFRGIADDMKLMEWLNQTIFPAEAKNVSPEFVYWGTLLAAIELARSGTTTFIDMYYFEDEIARAADQSGLRGIVGQTIIGFPAPDYKTPEAALAASEALIRKYKGHPRIIPGPAPHALYTTPLGVIKSARALAVEHGVPFQIHAAESPEEDKQITAKFGKTSVAVLEEAGVLGPGVILHHAITLSDDDIGRLARLGVATSHNPESNMKGASGLARVPDLLRAGVAVGLGTDGAASNNNLDLFEEMDTAAKVHKLFRGDPTVMSARDVFKMATIDGARALGLADQIGSLESGKLADLAIVDLREPELTPLYDVYSHLVYAIKGSHVRSVVVDGKVVVRDRKLTTVDTQEVLSRCRSIQRRILETLGRPPHQ